jgi:amino acid permease
VINARLPSLVELVFHDIIIILVMLVILICVLVPHSLERLTSLASGVQWRRPA